MPEDAGRPGRRAGHPQPAVSVVVPSHQGDAIIGRCLRSLAAQTLGPERFEVVVVFSGPIGAGPRVIEEVRRDHPALRLRTLWSPRPGASRARNLGLAAASGQHITFVDDDDWVSPTYLETLLGCVAPGVVPIAHVADVLETPDGPLAPDFDNYISRYLLPLAGQTFEVGGRSTGVGFVAAKLVPAGLARSVRFDESLASGEDAVYWHAVYVRAQFALHSCPIEAHAVYYRSLRPQSASRQPMSFDFSVRQRLDVVDRLAHCHEEDEAPRALHRAIVAAKVKHIAGYLEEHPTQLPQVVAEIEERGLREVVSLRELNYRRARDLAVLYAFAPYADTSATVAARRIRERGTVVDVVSCQMTNMCDRDPTTALVADPFVGRHHEVPAFATPKEWKPLDEFCREGMRTIAQWVRDKGPYRSVYSRVMQPGSHLLAALVKLRWPETRWIAEFSDPLVMNPYGEERDGPPVRGTPVARTLLRALRARGVEVDGPLTTFRLAELLAYALADDIVFTNEKQREFMLGYLPEQHLVPSVLQRSRVAQHPTLPEAFYHRVESSIDRVPGRVNVGYFGAFYLTRGLTEVIDALAALDADERARVVLRVFTSNPETLRKELVAHDLQDVVLPAPYVSYLEFLNLTTRMDVLLVNDARTRQHYDVNPYLPSKWSDYAGSGTDVWTVVEPGSVLSGKPAAYRSELGDVAGAAEQLRKMIADHAPALFGEIGT